MFEQHRPDDLEIVATVRMDKAAGERLLVEKFGRTLRLLLNRRHVVEVEACLQGVIREVSEVIRQNSALEDEEVCGLISSTLRNATAHCEVDAKKAMAERGFFEVWAQTPAPMKEALDGVLRRKMPELEACRRFGIGQTDFRRTASLLSAALGQAC